MLRPVASISDDIVRGIIAIDLDGCLLPPDHRKLTRRFVEGPLDPFGQRSLSHSTIECDVEGVPSDPNVSVIRTIQPRLVATSYSWYRIKGCIVSTNPSNKSVKWCHVSSIVEIPWGRSYWYCNLLGTTVDIAYAYDNQVRYLHGPNLGEIVGSSPEDVCSQILEKLGEVWDIWNPDISDHPVVYTDRDIEYTESYPNDPFGTIIRTMDQENAYPEQPSVNPIGTLYGKMVDDIKYVDVNSIAYIKDLPSTGDTIRSYLDALKTLPAGNTKAIAKAAASAYLSTKYGDKLAVADTLELKKSLKRIMRDVQGSSRFRARAQSSETASTDIATSTWEYHAMLQYNRDTGGVQGALRNLADADFLPTLSNTWDMVPYSFVVDWFVDVESVLSAYDAETYYNLISVEYAVYSTKRTTTLLLDLPGISNAKLVDYDRTASDKVVLPTPLLERSTGWKNNLLTGASLLANYC